MSVSIGFITSYRWEYDILIIRHANDDWGTVKVVLLLTVQSFQFYFCFSVPNYYCSTVSLDQAIFLSFCGTLLDVWFLDISVSLVMLIILIVV